MTQLSDQERTRRIRFWIRLAERKVLGRCPLLGRTDLMGMSLFVVAAGGVVFSGALYWWGYLPAWGLILVNAFLASVLHEIEHDLIHFLYFKDRPAIHNLMMFVVWALRGNIVHGWYRRRIHFIHHQTSGTESDIEERLLGLGMPWGFRRILIMVDGMMAYLLNGRRLEKEIPGFRCSDLFYASLPFYPLFVLTFVLTVGFQVFGWIDQWAGWALQLPGSLLALQAVAQLLFLGWVVPNYLRQACLQIVSSNVHYYGDVDGLSEQTQVLKPLILLPLQLFCWNFGSTHSFHHYVVRQPFYIRQLIAPWVHPAMRKYGVRFNDLGTFWRANRYSIEVSQSP